MTTLIIVYSAYFCASGLLFWRLSTPVAILVCFLGGWLILPVGNYPIILDPETFPWWITGLALPSDVTVNKAWVISLSCTFFGAIFNSAQLKGFKPTFLDVPMALWCVSPLVLGLSHAAPEPSPALSSILLASTWGLPWLIGRIWFSTADTQVLFLKACAWSGVACLPFALVEGVVGVPFYELAFGQHPFHSDGLERYIGLRPVGFFENGNQYGIWVCLSALSAFWVAVSRRDLGLGPMAIGVAVLCVAIAVLAQSIGALVLLLAGMFILMLWRMKSIVPLMLISLALLVALAVLHLSGIVPLEYIARQTKFGQMMLEGFRALGRGSFLWRISQELKAMQLLQDALVLGTGQWDWWRPSESRPWGLWLLIIGQFGLIGIVLSYGALIVSSLKAMLRGRGVSPWMAANAALPLAIIVALAVLDSFMNAFFYFPALIAAGAIVSGPSRAKQTVYSQNATDTQHLNERTTRFSRL